MITPRTLAELRQIAELANDLPGGSDWLHGEVADGTETEEIEKEITLGRLSWPEDPFYDMRAFQHSGIDDPVSLGLCSDPFSRKRAS